MRFRILGPLEVEDLADATALRRAKPRALLVLLLLNANRPLSNETLISGLWGASPPERALGSLQNYVSQLRKALGPTILDTTHNGYVLRVAPGELDYHVYRQLVAEAEGAEPAVRAERLAAALSVWRGAPLAGLEHEEFAQEVIARLEEERLTAVEALIEAKLELGEAGALVAELESLVAQNPLREHLRYLLILALYRSGRQADALGAYDGARRYLADEVGLAPSEELKRLQRAILQQDPSLGGTRAPERGVPTRPTRKPVTALLATGAPRDPRIDPEALRAVLAKVEPALREAVEAHGGMCDSFSSGELTAYFGVPAAHEDDALRAVRAADAIRTAVARINTSFSESSRMCVRIGIDSAEAVVEASSDGVTVTTAALPAARRLHERAGDDEILLGAGAVVLVRGAVALERVDSHADQDAFRLEALEPPVEKRGLVPFVGRRVELARLDDELARATTERSCRVVTVVGDPGVGKSRLAIEFAGGTDDTVRVLWGRCAAYGEGASFTPLAAIVRETTGELASDDEGRTIAERLGGLTGLTDAPVPTGDAFWAVRRFFERIASGAPLLFVLEDVHWAEPTLLDLVEYLRDWTRDAPLFVLCTARPELLEVRPQWGANALLLGPLDRSDASTVARGAGVLDDELVDRVVTAAEGNPLFTEQLAAEVAARPASALEPPPSLEALLASRLDALDAGERALVQRASILGREFTRDGLAHLTPPEERRTLEARLAGVVRRGVVHRARAGDSFTFHHGLVREAAYASAPKELRAALHERAAEWLGDDMPDEVVGYHFEAAARYLGELGRSDDAAPLAHRAGERLARAGVRAFGRADLTAALALLRRAHELLPVGAPRRLESGCELAAALALAGRAAESAAVAAAVEAEAATAGERRFVVRARVERAHVDLYTAPDRVAPALEVARNAIDELAELGDDRAAGRAWNLRGHIEGGFLLANAAWLDSIEHALFHYRRAGFPPSNPIGQFGAAAYYGPIPVERAIRRCEQLLADGDGGRNGDSILRIGLAGLDAFRGRFDEARRLVDLATATLVELGQARGLAEWADPVRADLEFLAGDLDAAERSLRTACDALERTGRLAHLSTRGAEYARILHALGRVDDAARWLGVAEQHAGPMDISAQFATRAVRARLLADAGAFDDAARIGGEAVAIADRTDALHQRALVRLDVAAASRAARRVDAARQLIDEADRLWTAKGSTAGRELARRAARELEQDDDERPPSERPPVAIRRR